MYVKELAMNGSLASGDPMLVPDEMEPEAGNPCRIWIWGRPGSAVRPRFTCTFRLTGMATAH